MKRNKGFTLIELMIVVAIVAILAMVIIPSYSDYVKRGKVAEATSNLAGLRVSMEQYYQDNRTYLNGANCGIGATPAATTYFTYACVATATTYTISAAGQGNLAGIGYTIGELNNKASNMIAPATTAGWINPNPNNCWATKPGGTC
jgi:type IV pilus assembly protein PilE